MSAVLDLAPAPMVAAGGYAWPDDVAGGKARQARIDKQSSKTPGIPARLAEEFVVAVGWDWHLPPTVTHMLQAAAAELVDNAVSHAKWPDDMHVVLVDVALHAHRVVLEVRDPDPQLPQIPEPTAGLDALMAALDDPEVSPEELEQVPHGLAYLSGLLESLAVLPEPIGKVLRATVALPDSRTGSVISSAGDASRTGAAR